MSDQAGRERELSAGLEPSLITGLRDLGNLVAEAGERLNAARSAPSDAQLAAMVAAMREKSTDAG